MVKVDGTYCLTRTQEQCDWLSEWYGDEVKQMVGVKLTCHIKELPNNKFCSAFLIDGFPQYNSYTLTTEGVENNIDVPMFGGKAKLTFHKTANGFTSVMESGTLGKWEWVDEFCPEGLKVTSKKDGKSMTEMWKRVIEENGFYVTTKTTNVEKFMKETQVPDALIAHMEDYKMCWKSCGDMVTMKEYFGDTEVVFTSKLDEENDYTWPIEGVPPSKYMITCVGQGKYCSMVKDEAGNETEWKFEFCGEGVKICGRNMKTGTTCSFEMCKQPPFFGKFKAISHNGTKESMMLLGCSEAEACEMAKSMDDLTVELQHKGPMVNYKYCTKAGKLDILFKWDEEVSYMDPVMKCQIHMTPTKTGGNTASFVTKMPTCTLLAKMTFNPNFVVEKVWIEGLDCMPWTVIYKRC